MGRPRKICTFFTAVLNFSGVPTGCSLIFFGYQQAVRVISVGDGAPDVPKINRQAVRRTVLLIAFPLMEKVLLYVSLYHKSFHFATSLLSFLYFAGICGIMGQNFFLGGLLCGLRLTNTGFICL